MKMVVLLLVSAAALLVSSSSSHHWEGRRYRLRSIIDHSRNVSVSRSDIFVDDVKQQYDCEDMFFCKVYIILRKNQHFMSKTEGQKLLRNLEMFNRNASVNCAEVPNVPTPTQYLWLTLPNLIKDLITCSQNRMWNQTHEPTAAQ